MHVGTYLLVEDITDNCSTAIFGSKNVSTDDKFEIIFEIDKDFPHKLHKN